MSKFKTHKAVFTQICLQHDWKQKLEAFFASATRGTATPENTPDSHTAKEAVSALIALLPRDDLHWQAAYGLGLAVARLAEEAKEEARIVVRRLMWSLNEESGNIGWGIPEALGCILASSAPLAGEYARIFLSYGYETGKDDNYLDFAALRSGVYWGTGYLAMHNHAAARPALGHLSRALLDADAAVAAMAAFALAALAQNAAGAEATESLDAEAAGAEAAGAEAAGAEAAGAEAAGAEAAGETRDLWQEALNNTAKARATLTNGQGKTVLRFFDGQDIRSEELAALLETAEKCIKKLLP